MSDYLREPDGRREQGPRIVLGSSTFGFGPVSKLTAIARALQPYRRVLIGDSVSTDFARHNLGAFDEVVSPSSPGDLDNVIRECDHVISVMDSDLVFRAVALGRPVLFVDSLFAFWLLETPPARIADLCASVRRGGGADVAAELAELSGHERQYAAHLLADVSIVQNFPGVPERLAEIRRLGADSIHLSGPIVDELTLADVAAGHGSGPDLLLSLGGFKNFLLDFDHNNAYLRLFERWMPDLLADWPDLGRVVVCSGGFADDRSRRTTVGSRVAELTCLSQPDFLQAVSGAGHCMVTPGLTAIHESTQLGRLPLALPEEHYGHIANLAGLRGTLFERMGSRFGDIIGGYAVPDDDFAGTAAIIAQVGALLSDDDAYRLFRRGMNERFEAFFALDENDRKAGVAELRELFGGPSFAGQLHSLFPEAGRQRGEAA